jgi:hypothetical protein
MSVMKNDTDFSACFFLGNLRLIPACRPQSRPWAGQAGVSSEISGDFARDLKKELDNYKLKGYKIMRRL